MNEKDSTGIVLCSCEWGNLSCIISFTYLHFRMVLKDLGALFGSLV
uniref:Uncharacterized protein n=1 Tax=Rhizophora mucronata TaxID=61149 RepID=A0A2P2PVC0_RHIMU